MRKRPAARPNSAGGAFINWMMCGSRGSSSGSQASYQRDWTAVITAESPSAR